MSRSQKSKEGWLFIDHRAGAGLPEHVARLAGYDPKLCVGGKLFEAGTITCSHCGNAYVKNKYRIRAREFCRKCDHYICDGCGAIAAQADYVHIPFRQLAEAAINSAEKGEAFDPASLNPPRIVVP